MEKTRKWCGEKMGGNEESKVKAGIEQEEEDNDGKKQKGVDMGLLVVGDRSFVGVTIVQG